MSYSVFFITSTGGMPTANCTGTLALDDTTKTYTLTLNQVLTQKQFVFTGGYLNVSVKGFGILSLIPSQNPRTGPVLYEALLSQASVSPITGFSGSLSFSTDANKTLTGLLIAAGQ